jgi:hypothetical protein
MYFQGKTPEARIDYNLICALAKLESKKTHCTKEFKM